MIEQGRLQEAQAAVRYCRSESNKIYGMDPNHPGRKIVTKELQPGDKGYLDPETNFVTVEFHNGFVTVSEDYYKKLGKRKLLKLTKF